MERGFVSAQSDRVRKAIAESLRRRPHTFVRRRQFDGWMLAAGSTSLLGCMLIVRSGEVGAVEQAVFRAINDLPDALRIPLWAFQIYGMLAFVAVAAVVAVGLRRYRLGFALGIAIPVKLMMEWWVVKALVERERPIFTVPGAIVRDVNTAPLGFPSGHAVFAFALAGLVAPYVGRSARVFVYTLAVLNATARVYLGAHNPLDVVAGGALGVAIAAALNLVLGVPRRTQ